jgi:hypothetical protein
VRRLPLLFLPAIFVFASMSAGSLISPAVASAATIAPTTTCSNSVDNTPGLGLICEVTVVNTITAGGGSATVTIRECHGAAGDPEAACTTTTDDLTEPVTAVTQCNGSTNGGGGTLRCSVEVTNLFSTNPSTTAATVNQCVGSGGGITTGCDPFPATTTGATITQCNGSANGGTLVELTCTASGTSAAAHGVTINQCNDSANGGGSLVICSATIANSQQSGGGSSAAPSSGGANSGAGTVTPPPTSTVEPIERPTGTGAVLLTCLALLLAVAVLVGWTGRRYRSR